MPETAEGNTETCPASRKFSAEGKVSNKHLSQLLIPLVVMNGESTAITNTLTKEKSMVYLL